MRPRFARRPICLTLMTTTVACYSWRPGPTLAPEPDRAAAQLRAVVDSLDTTRLADGSEVIRSGQGRLRLTLRDRSRVELLAPTIEGDSLIGIQEAPYGRLSIPLVDITAVEVSRVNPTGLRLLGITVGVGIGIVVGWAVSTALVPDFGPEK